MSEARSRSRSAREANVSSIVVPAQRNGDHHSVQSDVTSQQERTRHRKRPQRSPSKSYRRIIEAEVASGEEFIYADDQWKVDVHTPVRLLSYTQYLDFMDPRVAKKLIQSQQTRRSRTTTPQRHMPSLAESKVMTSIPDQSYGSPYEPAYATVSKSKAAPQLATERTCDRHRSKESSRHSSLSSDSSHDDVIVHAGDVTSPSRDHVIRGTESYNDYDDVIVKGECFFICISYY